MKFKKHIIALLLFLFVTAINMQSIAQCAMCRTTAESDLNNGGSIANGLNTGILYLMAIPYVLLMAGGYFFFKKRVDAKFKEWRTKIFPSKTKTVN